MASSNLFGSNVVNMTSSNRSLALDNLLRRELKISDPNDPKQVAQALLSRFKDDPRANAITQEAKGLPFLQAAASQTPMAAAPSSSDAELKQAIDDVNRDLEALLTNSLLKDVTPEIRGWAQAVRSAIQEGTTAARFALDPRQRDKAFAIRRQLGDYARVARFVGALTPTLNLVYRKFAQSLDEVAAILLVMMGEALANVGFSGGRFLLQTPYSELQVRRDAVIAALRNLAGATHAVLNPNEWPRGLDAYRSLFRLLEIQGQGDLRSLLVENELSRVMDELIQRAAHGNAEGLRALGATAKLDLQRFRRLIAVGQYSVSPESPPLVTFLEALQLFVDAFDVGGGFRLLRIARPPILFYGLYGMGGLTRADEALVELVMYRGHLAELLDCFLPYQTDNKSISCQVILDKILYDIDRAIDLYALGTDDFGEPERRAAVYAQLINQFNDSRYCSRKISTRIHDRLKQLSNLLDPKVDTTSVEFKRLEEFVETIKEFSNSNLPSFKAVNDFIETAYQTLPQETINYLLFVKNVYRLFSDITSSISDNAVRSKAEFIINDLPISLKVTLNIMHQEICIQKQAELRWENLVRSMSPNCGGFEVFSTLQELLNAVIDQVNIDNSSCEALHINIPPHIETSLDILSTVTNRIGEGRPTIPTLDSRS